MEGLLDKHAECTGCTFYRAEPVPKHWGSMEWPDTYSGGRWGPPCVPRLELASGSGQGYG